MKNLFFAICAAVFGIYECYVGNNMMGWGFGLLSLSNVLSFLYNDQMDVSDERRPAVNKTALPVAVVALVIILSSVFLE